MHNDSIMNRLSTEKRAQIVGMMVEGNSIRSITRMTGVCQEAILKLLCDLGKACADHHDAAVRNVHAQHVQCDATPRKKMFPSQNRAVELAAFGLGLRLTPIPN